ncbi:formate dehydrogenase accessory sulfurtransferase FdhD [Alkalibaculum sp. M08DMB]|uniref:Sulfur carrier protein FdhD n=1 Tax=Alkalibaculum sporogenes TaxID=2655001 RepID=A0A6A7KBA1_9FIRM|nr:formate dehydrogenase accessory sulfurtransferase FdhD [Alkalibaculum sporogenes]MPW26684.1 formate dehydrogenase accessory sulfurtransferase FdhD [Alkalibaculum sporogenes]
MRESKTYKIIRIQNNQEHIIEDKIAVEYSLSIYINSTYFVTLLCTPSSLEALIVGFLRSEGIIKELNDINDIKINKESSTAYIKLNSQDLFGYNGDHVISERTLTTACGKGRTVSFAVTEPQNVLINSINIDHQRISELVKEFSHGSELFKATGGVHSCAICTYEEILYFEEDIGRHNALEKVFGKAFLDDVDLHDKIVLTTGRITSEIVNKVIKRGVPLLVSRSAPSDIAIDLAHKSNLTIIGFVRGNKMNIYPALTGTKTPASRFQDS